MAALLNTLLEITVYSGILFLVILTFKKVFHKHISALLNYMVWMLLIVRLLIPVTIDSSFRLIVIPENTTQVAQTETDTNSGFSFSTQSETNHTEYTAQPQLHTLQQPLPGTGVSSDNASIPAQTVPVVLIDWKTAIVLAWGLGMIGYLLYIVTLNTRFRHVMKQGDTAVPADVLAMVDDCKKEIGIKANIPVSLQKRMTTPAMTLSLRPVLLLPESMLGRMSRAQIKLGIRHELTHYKRRDHLMRLLLLILRGVYWFNSFFWFAYRMILADMETACDAHATARLEKEQKDLYIHTIIDLGCDRYTRCALGMGANCGKKSVEKRIRGMFMKKKSKRFARVSALLLVPLMLIMCFTTACQPTPEQEFVQAKNNDEFNKIINQTYSPNDNEDILNLNIPKNITDTMQANDLTVNINAKVLISQTNYPVVYVEPHQIEQEQANMILNSLVGDAQLTGLREQDKIIMHSKEEIIKQLGIAKKNLSTAKDDKSILSLNSEIERLEAMLDSAPEQIDSTFVTREFIRPAGDGTVTVITDDMREQLSEEEMKRVTKENENQANDFQVIEGICDLGKDMPAMISIYKHDNLVYSHVSFNNLNSNATIIDNPELIRELSPNTDIQGLKTTYSEAYQQAIDVLGEMQIQNYGLLDSASAPLGNPKQNANEYSRCYLFIFSQPIEGMNVNYALATGNSEQVSEIWSQEYIKIYVDDTGIIGFYWDSPSKLVDLINSNVQLKSWDEILAIFKQQINNKYVFIENSSVLSREINIDQIKLGMMKIKEQSSGRYIYVPVWDFYGYSNNTYDSSSQLVLNEEGKCMIDRFGHSYLTINAIDGSVIDRNLGY